MISDGKKELAFMARTVREAWKACGGAELNTREKGAFDLVTDVDLAMENFIDAAIKENFPSDIVVGEELAPLRDMPRRTAWTVDPGDGPVTRRPAFPAAESTGRITGRAQVPKPERSCTAAAVFCMAAVTA